MTKIIILLGVIIVFLGFIMMMLCGIYTMLHDVKKLAKKLNRKDEKEEI